MTPRPPGSATDLSKSMSGFEIAHQCKIKIKTKTHSYVEPNKQNIKVNKYLNFFYTTQFLENNNWPLSDQNVEYLSLHLIVYSIAVAIFLEL